MDSSVALAAGGLKPDTTVRLSPEMLTTMQVQEEAIILRLWHLNQSVYPPIDNESRVRSSEIHALHCGGRWPTSGIPQQGINWRA